MTELMVRKEARFDGTRIVSVYEKDDSTIEICASSEKGAWFNPDSENAGEDGWVRNLTQVLSTFNLRFSEPEGRALNLETLRRWRDEKTVVTGFSSFEKQALGFVCRLEDGEVEVVAVRMPSADLDRV
jgi:hypothetical protein